MRTPIALLLASSALCGAVAGGAAGYWAARKQLSGLPQAPALAARPSAHWPVQPLQVVTSSEAIVQAVKKVSPAVVKIETQRAPSMFEIFDQLMSGMEPQPVSGVGSGFIFDYQGRKLVMTNTHVVGDAEQMHIKLTDGRMYAARLLGADPVTDLAVLEMVGAPPDLVAASLGDSDRLQVGEWVIAMGNPFDYENTVTVGVVSAKGFRPVGEGKQRKVIQTDAAINAGNSGGPLVDLGGNVVGINYKIFTTTGATVGIGFAIPINEAKAMLKPLVEGGPWVGFAALMPNSPGLAAHLGLPTHQGVVVLGLVPDSPAERAGFQQGDIILAVDGRPVNDTEALEQAVLAHSIGDLIQFTVQRGTQQLLLRVMAGKVPSAYRPGAA
jgi:serine protease Do